MRNFATPVLAFSILLSGCETFNPTTTGTQAPDPQVQAESPGGNAYCRLHPSVCILAGGLFFAGALIAILPYR